MSPMNDIFDSYTFRLFKRQKSSPFIEGAASLLDASDLHDDYNFDGTPAEADKSAIRADWLQVGKDLSDAMREYVSGQTS